MKKEEDRGSSDMGLDIQSSIKSRTTAQEKDIPGGDGGGGGGGG